MHKKVVFDTVIFVRSLINPDSFWGKLVFKEYDKYRLFVSKQTILELLDVLDRPQLTKKFTTIATINKRTVIRIVSNAEVVAIPEVLPVSRDPKDDKFLATAKAAGADYVVTEDTDLLDLKEYEGVKIITGAAFLQIIKG